MKNKLIIILPILIITIIIFFISFSHSSTISTVSTPDIILKDNLTVEVYQEATIQTFIEELSGTLLNNPKIDTTILGKQKLTINYQNLNGQIRKQNLTIEVVDTTPPTILLGDSYTLLKGTDVNLLNTITSFDNYDNTPQRKLIGEYDLNTPGQYPLTYQITDSSGNTTTKDFLLTITTNQSTTTKTTTSFADVVKQYKTSTTKIGLDVSKWQGEIDFAKLKQAQVEFIMIRLGRQDSVGSSPYVDPYFLQNLKSAQTMNILVGVYFYSNATSTQEAQDQALWVVEQLKDYPIDLPIVFDWENWSQFNTMNLSQYKLNQIANTFLETIEQKGYTPMLYSSKYYLETIWTNQSYYTWLAHYTNQTDYQGNYLMWQLSNTGKVSGISGYVDIDIMYQEPNKN